MINICFVSNDNYVPYIETLIVSILRNSDTEDFFHFHIIEDDISKESKNKINKLKEIKNFNLDFYTTALSNIEKYKQWVNYYKTNKEYHPWNHMVWYKLDIPFLLKDLDKVLFLDADSIAIDNIKNIYETDNTNYYSIVSKFDYIDLNSVHPNLYKWIKEVVENDDSDNRPNYLVGPMILLNLKKIREEIGLEKLEQEINYCFDNYKDIIFTEEHIYMYIFRDKTLYKDMGLDISENKKVYFVSMYFGTPIGKPLSRNFDRDLNKYFYKFWEYFTQTPSFNENKEDYLDIYYYTKTKQKNKILIDQIIPLFLHHLNNQNQVLSHQQNQILEEKLNNQNQTLAEQQNHLLESHLNNQNQVLSHQQNQILEEKLNNQNQTLAEQQNHLLEVHLNNQNQVLIEELKKQNQVLIEELKHKNKILVAKLNKKHKRVISNLNQKNELLIEKINKVIDKIVWYIPIKKLRDDARNKLKSYLEI